MRPMKKPVELGKYIVADPRICHGKPTFNGSRVMVWQVLDHPDFEKRDTSSVQSIGYGGAPVRCTNFYLRILSCGADDQSIAWEPP